ncbi:MAG: hypothetical protein KBE39_02185 [Parabacteroides sp.]|jgi:hypothetical protein|nr:hypothetical protein [Parabacteroides sp.]MBP9578332.1 hypothetical protein [Parabacteroides sp.]MDD2415208.1 hypothetical protein [Parabacteroides sp.]MDD4403712.1 hypothetical protein [Parabacteroides sp.]
MTEEQMKLIAVFESKVRQLMYLCDEQKQELSRLKEALNQKDSELQREILRSEELAAKCNNLLTARIISVKEGEVKSAKTRLSKLVREVDKCIALLNE